MALIGQPRRTITEAAIRMTNYFRETSCSLCAEVLASRRWANVNVYIAEDGEPQGSGIATLRIDFPNGLTGALMVDACLPEYREIINQARDSAYPKA